MPPRCCETRPSTVTCALLLALALSLVGGCASVAPDRPVYGQSPFPVWHPLTRYEIAALRGRAKAERGDWRSLLRLGLVASGSPRDTEELVDLEAVVDDFLSTHSRDLIAIRDHFKRARQLLWLLHRDIFQTSEAGQLGRYRAAQSQLSVVLQDGTYNCISSALLYMVVARAVGLQALGVKLPHHAYIELRLPDGRRLDVETTAVRGVMSPRGPDWFRSQSGRWGRSRGLRPPTWQQYQRRQIVQPLRLVADNMNNQHAAANRMPAADNRRLRELRGELLPRSRDAQLYRLHALGSERNEMHQAAEHAAITRMYKAVEPALAKITKLHGTAAEIKNMLGWHRSHYASALQKTGRWPSAQRWLDYTERLLPGIKDAARIEHNLLATAWKEVQDRVARGDVATAIRIANRWRGRCSRRPWCQQNMRWLRQYQR
jgi:hypothetical protein